MMVARECSPLGDVAGNARIPDTGLWPVTLTQTLSRQAVFLRTQPVRDRCRSRAQETPCLYMLSQQLKEPTILSQATPQNTFELPKVCKPQALRQGLECPLTPTAVHDSPLTLVVGPKDDAPTAPVIEP